MIKNNKITLLVTSLVIVLPMAAGAVLWNHLPEKLATHWGTQNEPNGFSSKPFAVFGIPLILLTLHWLCVWASDMDKRQRRMNRVVQKIVLWILPACSVLLFGVVYAYGLGRPVNVGFWACLFVGLLFVVIGNYLPKCPPSYITGIKLPWTLADDENWRKTHRMAGPLWMAGGFVVLITSFWATPWILLPVMIAMVVIPTAYSYGLYKKGQRAP